MKIKKLLATVSAIVVTAAGFNVLPVKENGSTIKASAAMDVNYAEALQKSVFFYEVQQEGILPE